MSRAADRRVAQGEVFAVSCVFGVVMQQIVGFWPGLITMIVYQTFGMCWILP